MTRSEADADAVSGPGDQVPMRGGDGDDGQGGTQSDARPQEQQLIVSRFFRGGKLRQFPVKRKARVAVLLELVSLLEPGRTYSEPEVSELLGRIHGDYATLRRELVDYGYVLRDAGVYRLAPRPPARAAGELPVVVEWESNWLAPYLRKGLDPMVSHPTPSTSPPS